MFLSTRFLSFFFTLFTVLLLFGCGGGSSGSDSDSSDTSTRISTNCGAIADASLQSEVDLSQLEEVSVDVKEPDKVIVSRTESGREGNKQLIKLLGVDTNNVSLKSRSNGIKLSSKLSKPVAYLLHTDDAPQEYVDPNGGRGVYGQLFSADGRSLSEELLLNGYAQPAVDGLFSDQLYECYTALEDTSYDDSAEFASTCGVINAGQLQNPVKASQFDLVSVNALSPDFMVVTLLEGIEAGKEIGIKLHGVSVSGASSYNIDRGMQLIEDLSAANAYLLRTGRDCIYTSNSGDQATLAQLFSLDGRNFNEELLAVGAVTPDNNGCSAKQLSACYNSIKAAPPAPPEPSPIDEDEDEQIYDDSVIDDFLWKPVSESNGNLVVLVNPRNVQVRVIGAITENLVNTGASNGRGTTARASRSGCSYGRNIKVEFYSSSGEKIALKNGEKSVHISNGCDRVEFKL